MSEPMTEAGRLAASAVKYLSDQFYHHVFEDGSDGGDYIEAIDILAIEAEARADHERELVETAQQSFYLGRADALREAEPPALATPRDLRRGYRKHLERGMRVP